MIAAATFDRLFADEPTFRKGIADLLAKRLRRRTSSKDCGPTCVLVGLPSSPTGLSRALVGCGSYARVVEIDCFAPPPRGAEALGREIDAWRALAHSGDVFVGTLPVRTIPELRAHMRHGDAVLLVDEGTSPTPTALSNDWSVIDTATIRIGSAARRQGRPDEVWSYCIEDRRTLRPTTSLSGVNTLHQCWIRLAVDNAENDRIGARGRVRTRLRSPSGYFPSWMGPRSRSTA